MVWKTRKGRHRRSKTTPSSPGLPKAQNLKSCLKSNSSQSSGYGDSAARGTSRSSAGSGGGTRESGEYMRDHSTKSARSYFSGYSSSSGGAQSEGNNSHIRYTESPGSGNSNLLSHAHFNRMVMEKKVRFGNIQLREHERAVGDNPSCSTGPPVGIGWRHSETKIINIDEFERERAHKPKCNVLTRSKREELLLDWGISFNDIIDAIRTNIKVKNQRRQTVTNLGKIERIEEALESATRKIKRAFLLRKPTGRKAKQLQQQAQVVAAREFHELTLGDINVDELEELRKMQSSPASDEGVHEPDVGDSIESDPKFRKMASSLSLSEIDDHLSSGLSLGNSATTSVREIEQFYRDLEMEMFGDLPLPDMVGETLEVPSLYIPEEERMYHDPTAGNHFPEPRSVAHDENKEVCESAPRSFPQHMNNIVHTSELAPGAFIIPPNTWNDPSCMPAPMPYNMANGGMQFGNAPVLTRGVPVPPNRNPRAENPPPQRENPSPTPQDQGLSSSMHSTERKQQEDQQGLSSSLHSTERKHLEKQQADMTRRYLAHTVTAMEQRYLHPSLAPPPPPPAGYEHGASPPPASSGDSKKQGKRDHRGSSSRRRDGPEIRHIPFSYHSPAYWLADGPRIAFQQFEPVTITEDSGRGVLESSQTLKPSPPRPPMTPPMSGGSMPMPMPIQMPQAMQPTKVPTATAIVPPPQTTTASTTEQTTVTSTATVPTTAPTTAPTTTTATSPKLGSSPPLLKGSPPMYSSVAPDLVPSPPDVKVPLYVAPARFPTS
eukprot:Nitzschia sp. Nitz4//scaffold116_size91068//7581//10009//NITZ4_004946-RA/size91068-snap-gene-0.1-mRNA-1//1//CDS//3329533542//6001//frame0